MATEDKMTRRDWFAAAALTGLMAGRPDLSKGETVGESFQHFEAEEMFRVADLMMEAADEDVSDAR